VARTAPTMALQQDDTPVRCLQSGHRCHVRLGDLD
jgi:hypothetical protein